MNLQPRRAFVCTLFLACLTAVPAFAQSTREEWLAARTRKQAREDRLPPNRKRFAVLTPAGHQFFIDPSGNIVVVGEVRNDTPFRLIAYARIELTFRNGTTILGREWAYVHGGVNARISANNAYETFLAPGEFGLIWQHRVDGRVAVWLMNGTTMLSGIVIARLADTNWELVGPR